MQTRASCASKSSRPDEAHVVGRDDRHAEPDRQLQRARDAVFLARPARALQFEVVAVTEQFEPGLERRARFRSTVAEQRAADVAFARAGQRDQALCRVAIEPRAVQRRAVLALPFEVAARDQAREVQVAAPVLAEQHQSRRFVALVVVAHQHIHADQRLDALRLRGLVELDQREEVGLVGQRDRRHAHACGRVDEPFAHHAARPTSSLSMRTTPSTSEYSV